MSRHIIASITILILMALAFLRNQIWGSEFSLWSDALKKSPNKPRVLDSVGKSLENRSEIYQAIDYYKKALEIEPTYIWARHHLFNAYIKLKMPDEALKAINDPRHQAIRHAGLYKTLSELYIQLKEYERAEESFEEAIKLEPDNVALYISYGIFLIERKKIEKAIEVFKKGLKISPGNPALWNNLGIALEIGGKLKEAEEAYQRALYFWPEAEEAKENLQRLLNSKR